MKFFLMIKSCLLIFLMAAPAGANQNLSVFVSIVPQKYFVQRIAKDRVSVSVMVLPGASPAVYEPKPRQMAELAEARIYFAIGVPFEGAWMDRIAGANPKMKVVHCDKGIEKMAMAAHRHEHDAHEHSGQNPDKKDAHDSKTEHEHHHAGHGLDPHIWLSVPLVKIQAKAILDALKQEDPENAGFYQTNHDAFMAELNALDRELKTILAAKKGAAFMVFHPSWGYFARDYGLVQMPIELEGKSPKPAQLVELVEMARARSIEVVFVSPQFSQKSAQLIAREIKGRVVVADPLARDWADNLKKTATRFAAEAK